MANTYTSQYTAAQIEQVISGNVPTATLNITANGTYDVTNYASAAVNVAGGGLYTFVSGITVRIGTIDGFAWGYGAAVPLYFRHSDFYKIVVEFKPGRTDNNIFFLAMNSSAPGVGQSPYLSLGYSSIGYTTPTYTIDADGVYTLTSTSQQNYQNYVRIGTWGDSTFSVMNYYKSLKFYDSNDVLIHDVRPAVLNDNQNTPVFVDVITGDISHSLYWGNGESQLLVGEVV